MSLRALVCGQPTAQYVALGLDSRAKAQAARRSAFNYSGTSTLRHSLEVHVQLILVALQAHTPTSSYTYKHRKPICTDTQILSFIYNSPTERDRGTETAGRSLQQTAKTTTLLYQNPSAVFFYTKRPSMSARPLLYRHSDE